MDYKEKLEEAKRLYETANSDQKYVLETLFPELKEAEDERIRKEIIEFLQLPHPQFVGKRNHEKWIDWLEKQGEKKSGNINVNKMVMEYSQTNDGDFGLPVNCMIRAYRQGINDVLNKE